MPCSRKKKDRQEYDYAIEIVYDDRAGGTDVQSMEQTLKRRAALGWRLVTAFTNELGKNSVSYAGIGTNATIDQTVLIFEKRVYNPELEVLEQMNREKRTDIEVRECNITEPFVPKSLTLITKGADNSVSITMQNQIGFSLKGLQGTLVFYNIFGDTFRQDDVCFFNFETVNPMICASDAFPIHLPDRISRGIDSVGLIVKRYLDEDGVHLPEDSSLVNIKQRIIEKADGFDRTGFIERISTMGNAGEITMYVRQLSNETAGVFNEDIIQQLFKLYTLERSSGSNLKEDAINRLTSFLNS